ncbi:MAG: bifunctional lysylphosphatidylglycerol flippase/synthetase MprF [Planctomycetia bacterium]|nr:bifunctional lysylphosphatidylglycerol flippase/synthetase MprF [Planctomycetia bacterium]
MRRIGKWLGPILVLGVLAGALYLLHHELHKYKYSDVKESLSAIPVWKLAACAGLTTLNYLILIGYDLVGVRSIGHPLPLRRVALASFTGFAMSYNFGALFGGTPVRIRLYSSFGMSAAEIVKMMVAIGTTFWVGVFALAGVMFIVDPMPIPEALHVAISNVRPIGIVLLVLAIAYVCLPLVWKKPLRWGEHEVSIPATPTLLMQLVVSAADLAVAAGSLYVVLPKSMALSYPQFLGVYLLAIVAVVFTHVPGGVGILELIIVTFAATESKQEVLAALLAFRVIYYLIPLALAFVCLLVHEVRLRSEQAQKIARRAGIVLGGVTPTVVSLGTMLTGAVLLISGSTPALPDRLSVLRSFLSLPAIEVSHFMASLIGGGLLILGRGLQRRLDAAWWGAVILLIASMVFSLTKGLDFEEAIAAGLVLAALIASRKRFYRRGSILHPAWTRGWIVMIGITLLCSIWLGVFVHKHVDYRREMWWQFAVDEHAPRLLRGTVGVTVLLLGFASLHLIAGRAKVKVLPALPAEIDEAAAIVARSPRSSANLALLGGKILLFNEARTALIMHGIQGRSWISMGDPIGPDAEWSELIWQFREECDQCDSWPVFYQVEADNIPLYLDHGFSLLKLGEEARINAAKFSLDGGSRKGLRQNRNRLQKEGYALEIVPRESVPELLPTLKSISDAWLGEKQGSEKGFSLGYFEEAYLRRFPCAVVRKEGEMTAFANLWLGAGNEEFSVDLMRHRPDSQRGIMDFLFVELLLWGQSQGYQWFNMGMAPLSGIEARQLSPLWNKFASLLFKHGDQFYGFEGLRDYKDKFDPVWTPKYLAARGGLALPRILADVTALIGRKR